MGVIALAAAVLIAASAARAQNPYVNYWNVAPSSGTASWSNTANWTYSTNPSSFFLNGGSVIDNGGTATIAAGDNVTDATGSGYVGVGGSSGDLGGSGGSGYVTMSGGASDGRHRTAAGSTWRRGRQRNLHSVRRHQRRLS